MLHRHCQDTQTLKNIYTYVCLEINQKVEFISISIKKADNKVGWSSLAHRHNVSSVRMCHYLDIVSNDEVLNDYFRDLKRKNRRNNLKDRKDIVVTVDL